jgi:hypothetical protein
VVLLAFVLIGVAVGGCTYKESDWIGTTEGPSTTAHTPPKFGDTVSAWDVEITASGPVLYEDDSTTMFVGEGKEAWVVIANIRNTGSKDFSYSLASWEGRDQDGRQYRASVDFPVAALTDGTIPPGGIAGGNVGFVLSRGSALASVAYRPAGVDLDPVYIVWEG